MICVAEVELVTVPNILLKLRATYVKPSDFVKVFDQLITHNPHVELAYASLLLAPIICLKK